MTKKEKIKYISDLLGAEMKRLKLLITNGDIPAEWDGHELLAYVSDRAANNASRSVIKLYPRDKRARAYHNEIITSARLL
jgi:hypothetical protein